MEEILSNYSGCCRMTSNATRRFYRKQNMLELLRMFGTKCSSCGKKTTFEERKFVHKDPAEKRFNIEDYMQAGWWHLKKEAVKCYMVCRDCHLGLKSKKTTQEEKL